MITLNGIPLNINKFPNGELHLDLAYLIESDSKAIDIAWKYESDSDFFTLKVIKDYLSKHLSKSYNTLHILYLPYSRMDRSENNSVFTLASVSNWINDLMFDEVYIGEPHSPVSLELIPQAKEINITEALFKEHKTSLQVDVPLVPFYPDAGAKKRYAVNTEINLVGKKTRNFETGKIESYEVEGKELLPEGDFDVVILDDLSSFGGTFVKAAIELRKVGARKIYLIVAHAENNIFKGELFEHIEKVITTNSILNETSNQSIEAINNKRLIIKKLI